MRVPAVLVLFGLLVQLPLIGNATIVKKFSLETLTKNSSSIVVGKITDTSYRMESGEIWTIVTVHVEKTLKGDSSQTILFRVPGGIQKIGSKTLVTKVEGAPDFVPMDRAVLFLEGGFAAYPSLLGLDQGCWKISQSNGRETAFSPAFQELSLEALEREIVKSSKLK